MSRKYSRRQPYTEQRTHVKNIHHDGNCKILYGKPLYTSVQTTHRCIPPSMTKYPLSIEVESGYDSVSKGFADIVKYEVVRTTTVDGKLAKAVSRSVVWVKVYSFDSNPLHSFYYVPLSTPTLDPGTGTFRPRELGTQVPEGLQN